MDKHINQLAAIEERLSFVNTYQAKPSQMTKMSLRNPHTMCSITKGVNEGRHLETAKNCLTRVIAGSLVF